MKCVQHQAKQQTKAIRLERISPYLEAALLEEINKLCFHVVDHPPNASMLDLLKLLPNEAALCAANHIFHGETILNALRMLRNWKSVTCIQPVNDLFGLNPDLRYIAKLLVTRSAPPCCLTLSIIPELAAMLYRGLGQQFH